MQSGLHNETTPSGDAVRTRRWHIAVRRRALRVLENLAWMLFFFLAAAILTLRYWIIPEIPRYRAEIEVEVSHVLGLKVEIARIDAVWQGWRPRIDLVGVRIFGHDGREAIALPVIESVMSWWSLASLQPRWHSLVIDRPKITLRRGAGGVMSVAGLTFAADGGEGDGRALEWLLAQREVAVRDGEFIWIDDARAAPPLALSDVQFRLRNTFGDYGIGLTAQLPEELGTGIELHGEVPYASFLGPAPLTARLYAELGVGNVDAWRQWIDLPEGVRAGSGAARLWVTVAGGALAQGAGDIVLEAPVLRFGADLPLLELSRASGHVAWQLSEDRYEVRARDLAMTPASGPALPPLSFDVAWGAGPASGGEFSAKQIDIEPLAWLSDHAPFPPAVRESLHALAPRGMVRNLHLAWVDADAPGARFTASTEFDELAITAAQNLPGFSGLAGTLRMSESGGTLAITTTRSAVEVPKVFPGSAIPLDSLHGVVSWRRDELGRLTARIESLSFANADLAGRISGVYATSTDGPGSADLSAELDGVRIERIGTYLPHESILGAGTRGWLVRALRGGSAHEVRMRLRGDLRQFPFTDPATGEFRISARVKEGRLDYAEGWPVIDGIEGDAVFERDDIQISVRHARVTGLTIAPVRVAIPRMLNGNVALGIEGEVRGDSASFLEYIEGSPLAGWSGNISAGMRASGEGALRLKLELPLASPAATRVSGSYTLGKNKLVPVAGLPPIESATGTVAFTESSFDLGTLQGRLLGGDISATGGMRRDRGLRIAMRGTVDAKGIQAFLGERFAGAFEGRTTYQAALRSRSTGVDLTVDSTLQGLASVLPAPVTKSAARTLPLHLLVQLRKAESTRTVLSLGQVLTAEAAMEPGRATRATLVLGTAPGARLRLPGKPGLSIAGSLPELSVDRWRAWIDSGPEEGHRSAFDNVGLDVRLGALDIQGKRFRDLAIQGTVRPDIWSAKVDSPDISGSLEYRNSEERKLTLRLARFRMPENAPEAAPPAESGPRPIVDAVVENLWVRGRSLGRMAILAEPAGREWRVNWLEMVNADATLSAKGAWKAAAIAGAPGAHTHLDFSLDARNAGKLLDRIGYSGMVRDGKASLSGTVSWDADPFPIDYSTMSGKLAFSAQDGAFLEIDPGLGKLVSLMNLQMLPRRATLDFRDVFSKGFQFEKISSSMNIARGTISTEDFTMHGSSASVAMKGEVDLARESQNLHVRIVPSLGDGACTAAILLNPISGLAACLALKVLPVGQMFAFEYTVTGSWSDPRIAKVQTPPPPPGRNEP